VQWGGCWDQGHPVFQHASSSLDKANGRHCVGFASTRFIPQTVGFSVNLDAIASFAAPPVLHPLYAPPPPPQKIAFINPSQPPTTPRANLHVVLCLSPVGEAFRERCRMFPGLVNCTAIDWFCEWPADALYEVAARRLADDAALPAIAGAAAAEAVRAAACRVLVAAHQSVEEAARRMWGALRRRVYVTPTNYLECVHNYATLLGEKRAELAGKAGKLQGGLLKLDETRTQVGAEEFGVWAGGCRPCRMQTVEGTGASSHEWGGGRSRCCGASTSANMLLDRCSGRRQCLALLFVVVPPRRAGPRCLRCRWWPRPRLRSWRRPRPSARSCWWPSCR
jgi:hypothetical protein